MILILKKKNPKWPTGPSVDDLTARTLFTEEGRLYTDEKNCDFDNRQC